MAIVRCAACGSPNVMRDKQAGGYSYSKGLLGSLLFGFGGAAAGVNGKTQTLYKCPDCGQTLTYSMPPEVLMEIETALIDPNFDTLRWSEFKHRYKNLEDSVLDRKIKQDETKQRAAAEKISHISESEFFATAKDVVQFLKKIGWYSWYNESDLVYDKKHLPSVEEYTYACTQIRKFIYHMPQFMSYISSPMSNAPANFSEQYGDLFDSYSVQRLLIFVMALDYYESTGKAMDVGDWDIIKEYFGKNAHLKELALRGRIIRDGRMRDLETGEVLTGAMGEPLLEAHIKTYNPEKIWSDEPTITDLLYVYKRHPGLLTLCEYTRRNGKYPNGITKFMTYIYPQLIVKNNCIVMNRPKFEEDA